MTRHWSPLAVVYLLLAVAGLVGTWWFNIRAIAESRNYLGDLFTSGPAVSSITVDLLVAAAAGSVFIIVEARRLGMRLGWLYVVGAGVTAFAFTFPLFLAMRQRALNARSVEVTDVAGRPDAAGRPDSTGSAASGGSS
ncbi:DUF2834 domain-containing protein [Agromyces sp. H66]|uniref:DUF2834 domain-containing protein n=1 Tax=Agromyces sp. H66 TaxID=2529859 RepID=UPI0010A9BF36|nr:DUF2834 domain-containing protein [Agromyces sp. H66]